MSLVIQFRRLGAAVAASAVLAVALSPASALPLPDASLTAAIASPQVDKVFWCRFNCGPGWGWRGNRWGYWGPAAVVGLAAGAVVGAAIASSAAPPPPVPAYGPCWRQVVGPYGGVHWQRVC